MRPSDFPRDAIYRDPNTPPFLEEHEGNVIAHVFSYADASRVQRNSEAEFSHDAMTWLPKGRHHLRWYFMWATDPGNGGRHEILRGLVEKWFRRSQVFALTTQIQEHARSLRYTIVEKGTGEFNLASDFAYPLALRTICSLVGIPLAREEWLRQELEAEAKVPGFIFLETRDSLESFFWETIAKRVANPENELLDRIIAAWKKDIIDDLELLAFIYGFVAAGTDTTGTSIVDAFALASEFDFLDHLRYHLHNDHVLNPFTSEVLRYVTPFPMTPGIFTTKPVSFGGLSVPPHTQIHVHLSAANRGPEINGRNNNARDPNEFDPTRAPNRHMSFGVGPHYCLGDKLTQHEMIIALRELLTYLPELRMDETKPFQRYAGIVDGVTDAHFRFNQRKAEKLLTG